MQYPHKYLLDEQKIVWKKKWFFQKKTTTVEIHLKDIEKIRFLPASWIYSASSMVIYSRTKKITILTRYVGLFNKPESKYLTEFDALVYYLLQQIYNNKNIKYCKGHTGYVLYMVIFWIIMLPTSFLCWQLVYSYINKGDFMQLISFFIIPIASTAIVILGPLFIIRSMPKSINSKHILKYSPKVLFNRAYRKFIYEETGEKID